MFIKTEETPNPETLKFLPGQAVMSKGTAEFKSEDDAIKSPLAKRLLQINGVKSVFFAADFIAVTKDEDLVWDLLTPHVMNGLMEHFTSGLPVVEEVSTLTEDEDDNEIVKQIKEILAERVRPAVAMDGGDIEFHSFEEGVVYLRMKGACSGCPSSTMTLKAGVENLLKHFIPEVTAVEAVTEEDSY